MEFCKFDFGWTPTVVNLVGVHPKNIYCEDEFFEEIICGRLVVDYQPSRLNINCCGRLSAMLHDIHLQQTIFNYNRWYSSDGDDIHLKQTIFIRWKRFSFKRDEYRIWWLILEITINHWRWYSTTVDDNQPLGMIIGRHRWYIVCSRWIYHKWLFQKNYLDPNYLPRKISNIHFYDNRKINFFQFMTPNLEFIYYLWLLIIKMESYKEEKIVSWSEKIRFSNHLP
jgi:hypothetical protein